MYTFKKKLTVKILLLNLLVSLNANIVDHGENTTANEPSTKGEDLWSEDDSNEEEPAHKKVKRDTHMEYSYSMDSVYKPENWKKYYKGCGGEMQSPINITIADASKYKLWNPLRTTNIDAKPLEVMATHTGKTSEL